MSRLRLSVLPRIARSRSSDINRRCWCCSRIGWPRSSARSFSSSKPKVHRERPMGGSLEPLQMLIVCCGVCAHSHLGCLGSQVQHVAAARSHSVLNPSNQPPPSRREPLLMLALDVDRQIRCRRTAVLDQQGDVALATQLVLCRHVQWSVGRPASGRRHVLHRQVRSIIS